MERLESVSPYFDAGETAGEGRLFLLAGGLLAGDGRALLGVGAAGSGLFLAGLLLVGFRGFIAHNFNLILRFDSPSACWFLRWRRHHAWRENACK